MARLLDVRTAKTHAKVPDMPEREFPALLLSVKMHGVLVPVEILSTEDAEKSGEAHHAGMVLDGRQRIRAAKEYGNRLPQRPRLRFLDFMRLVTLRPRVG